MRVSVFRKDIRIELDATRFMVTAFSLELLGHLLVEKPFTNLQRVRNVLVSALYNHYQRQYADSTVISIAPVQPRTIKTFLHNANHDDYHDH